MKLKREQYIILSLALLKLLIHLLTMHNYELQRDAYLYYTLGQNLDWGFVSVPPLIGLIAWISTSVFGNTVFAMRIFPALIGSLSVLIIARIVKELKGGTMAIIIACLAFILSPAFLRSNLLFQPVTFNQFFWLLSFYFLIRLISCQDPKYWIWIFITWGFGFLNKYSIAFIIPATLLGLLLTSQRKLLFSKYFIIGGGVALLIILPNLLWQYTHNWPVVHHMAELQRTQFINVTIAGFIIDQFFMNAPAIIVWITGLVLFLFSGIFKPYRVLAYTYFLTVLILMLLRGKSYYTLGLYTSLFAMGGIAMEYYYRKWMNYATMGFMVIITAIMAPISLPVLSLEQVEKYTHNTAEFTNRWEDGQIYAIPQDFADMTGWKELGDIVIREYLSLDNEARKNCAIFADNYGQAGAVNFYGKKYGLPQPLCFNDNFVFWAPDSIDVVSLIYINHGIGDLNMLYDSIALVGIVDNRYFREDGLQVYYCTNPTSLLKPFYAEKVAEIKKQYSRKSKLH